MAAVLIQAPAESGKPPENLEGMAKVVFASTGRIPSNAGGRHRDLFAGSVAVVPVNAHSLLILVQATLQSRPLQ